MKHLSSLLCGWLVVLWAMGATVARAQAPSWQMAVATGVGPNSSTQISATATDAAGNVYVVGSFNAVASFGNITLTSNGLYDAFVAKWNPATGSFVWALKMGGSQTDYASAVAISGSSIYVGGNFQSTGVFGGTSLTSAGFYDGFVTKLTDLGASANFVWTQQLGGDGPDVLNSVAVSATNVFVTGFFAGFTASFGPITLTNSSATSTSALNNGYVAKLLDTGTSSSYLWAYDIGSPNGSAGYQVAVSGSSVYLAGTLETSATFGTIIKISAGGRDAFLAKLLDGGNTATFLWAQTVGGAGTDFGYGLALAGTAVYLTGNFEGIATFGSTVLTSAGGFDGFVLKCTDAGTSSTVTWVQQMGGTGNLEAYGTAAIGTNIYLVGLFFGAFSVGNTNFTAVGGSDVFVAKFTDVGTTGSVEWAQKAGGTGPDVSTSLTVTPNGTIYVGGSAVAPAAFGTLALGGISGNRTGFFATLTAPILTTPTANWSAGSIRIFPNPTHGRATVQLPAVAGATSATLTLLDALGRTVRAQTAATNARTEMDLTGLAPGLYAVRVTAGASTATRRLVVE